MHTTETEPPELAARGARPTTLALRRLRTGDSDAADAAYDLVQDRLLRLARGATRNASADATFQPTALVHEAWLRLRGAVGDWRDRDHFFSTAARAMRAVLVDATRRRTAAKRGGAFERVPLEAVIAQYEARSTDLVALDDALEVLAERSPRQARVVELRFFGGLTIDQTARVIGVGTATVERDWHLARIWLRETLE